MAFRGTEPFTVNARDLHKFLGVGARFNDWIRRMVRYYAYVEGQDFYLKMSKSPLGTGRARKEYYLTGNMAKELAILQPTEKSKKLRKKLVNNIKLDLWQELK